MTEETLTPQQQIEQQLKRVREQTQAIFKQVEEEGITTEAGKILVEPKTIMAEEVEDTTALPIIPFTGSQEATDSMARTIAEAGSLINFYQQQFADTQKQLEELRKKTEGLKMPELEAEKKLREERVVAGIPGMTAEIQQQALKVAELKGNIDKLDMERLNEINRIYAQQGVGMRFIRGQAGEAERQYTIKKGYASAELGAQAALLQAQTGNLELANNMVKDIVSAYTTDIQIKRQDAKYLLDNYKDLIGDLRDDQKDILNNLVDRLEKEETTARTEKTQVMEWMIKYPTSGITIGDSLENAAKKAQKQAGIEEEKKGVGELLVFNDVMQKAIDAGATPQQAVEAAQLYASNLGISLKAEQLSTLLGTASKMTKAPIVPVIPEAPRPSIVPEAREAGAGVRKAIARDVAEAQRILTPIGKGIYAIGGFFRGLFGR